MSESSTDDEALKGGASEQDAGASGQAEPQDDNAAESSTTESKDDKKPVDMVSAVRAALSDGKEQPSGSGEGEGDEPRETDLAKTQAKVGEEDLGELTDEELNSYKPKTQARIKQLLKKSEDLSAKFQQVAPKADKFDVVQKFVSDANLTDQDVNTGFNIMKLMKNDPVQAFEALTPIYNALCKVVGDVLPDDLVAQVQEGKITMQHAKELSRMRAERGLNAHRSQNAEEMAAQQEEKNRLAEETKSLSTSVGQAITELETSWSKTDPDYSLKSSRVMEVIELEVLKRQNSGNSLRTPQQAVELAKTAKKKVDEEMKKLRPRKSSVTPITGIGATNGSKPVPKSVYDAVAQAVGHA